jgi:hypothetical protein
MSPFEALNHWIHLISAVIWIGALGFVVMALHPALKEKFPRDFVEHLAKNLRERYSRIVGGLVVLLFITGGLNVRFVRHSMLEEGGLSKIWLLFLGLKLTLFTGLVSLYLLSLLYRNDPWNQEQTEIRWARSSFVLGVLIVLLAAFLRHSHSH